MSKTATTVLPGLKPIVDFVGIMRGLKPAASLRIEFFRSLLQPSRRCLRMLFGALRVYSVEE
jgi:hypothetical protein